MKILNINLSELFNLDINTMVLLNFLLINDHPLHSFLYFRYLNNCFLNHFLLYTQFINKENILIVQVPFFFVLFLFSLNLEIKKLYCYLINLIELSNYMPELNNFFSYWISLERFTMTFLIKKKSLIFTLVLKKF